MVLPYKKYSGRSDFAQALDFIARSSPCRIETLSDVLPLEPVVEIADLYTHRWEIELGYTEQKKYMLGSRLTLRSRKLDIEQQELLGILPNYNLVRYQMVKLANPLKADYLPCQLSFNG